MRLTSCPSAPGFVGREPYTPRQAHKDLVLLDRGRDDPGAGSADAGVVLDDHDQAQRREGGLHRDHGVRVGLVARARRAQPAVGKLGHRARGDERVELEQELVVLEPLGDRAGWPGAEMLVEGADFGARRGERAFDSAHRVERLGARLVVGGGRHPAQGVGQTADELRHNGGAGVERLALVGMGRPVGGGDYLCVGGGSSFGSGRRAGHSRRGGPGRDDAHGAGGPAAGADQPVRRCRGRAGTDSAIAGLPQQHACDRGAGAAPPRPRRPCRPGPSARPSSSRGGSRRSTRTPRRCRPGDLLRRAAARDRAGRRPRG